MLKDYHCKVIAQNKVGRDLYVLRLQAKEQFHCLPGQFVMLDLPTEVFYFRRPFSVMTCQDDGSFDIFYKVVGTGTQMMAEFQTGQTIKILGPLGNTFSEPQAPENALLIGGGIGIAPLICLGQKLRREGKALPHCVYGVYSKEYVGLEDVLIDTFGKDKVHISTDDGSQGFKGNVCELMTENPSLIENCNHAMICGPTRMMEAASNLVRHHRPDVLVEVSLEEVMPCGTGACSGCVVFRSDQILPSKVCVEGPVFEARQIQWHPETTVPQASKGGAACPT